MKVVRASLSLAFGMSASLFAWGGSMSVQLTVPFQKKAEAAS